RAHGPDQDASIVGQVPSAGSNDHAEAAGRSLARVVDRLITGPLDLDAMVAVVLEHLVPAWCEAAVLDWMDDRGGVRRLGVATHGRGDSLAPVLAAVETDTLTREAVMRVRRTGRTATSVVWTPPAADLPPVDDTEEGDGAVRWHVHTVPFRVRGTLGGTLTLLSSRRMANGLGTVVSHCADRLAPALELARLDAAEVHERARRPPDPPLQLL